MGTGSYAKPFVPLVDGEEWTDPPVSACPKFAPEYKAIRDAEHEEWMAKRFPPGWELAPEWQAYVAERDARQLNRARSALAAVQARKSQLDSKVATE